MRTDKSYLQDLMRLSAFTILELLIVLSIIALLTGILVPCLNKAKQNAYDLFTTETEVDEHGNVRLEIRKTRDQIYLISIPRPADLRISLKQPHPSGMKLITRNARDYIKWRPGSAHVGVHLVTIVFQGQETFEQQIRIHVSSKDLVE